LGWSRERERDPAPSSLAQEAEAHLGWLDKEIKGKIKKKMGLAQLALAQVACTSLSAHSR
jgi:hypothetical protein